MLLRNIVAVQPLRSSPSFLLSTSSSLRSFTMTAANGNSNGAHHEPQPPSAVRLGLDPSKPPPQFQLPEVQGFREVHDNESRLKSISHDFRSDTLTVPTERMFKAMADASRGDDVYEVCPFQLSSESGIDVLESVSAQAHSPAPPYHRKTKRRRTSKRPSPS